MIGCKVKNFVKFVNLTMYFSKCCEFREISELDNITVFEKVSSNIASEASYIYFLSGKKFIKSGKNGQFGEIMKI